MELVAPTVVGFKMPGSDWIRANDIADGCTYVLFDALAIALSEEAANELIGESTARDFVAYAFAHCKFIGFTLGEMSPLRKTGIKTKMDEELTPLDNAKAASEFVTSCRKLRILERKDAVKLRL